MRTDQQLYELFSAWPQGIYELLGLDPPAKVTARSESFKKAVETTVDFVVEPENRKEPIRVIEFHGCRDKKFIPKLMLRCALLRMKFPARPIRCHVIYLVREAKSADVDDGGLFQPRVHFLADLVAELAERDPDSPVSDVLFPVVADSDEELTRQAKERYSELQESPKLDDDQREIWLDVFQHWVMHRLKIEPIQFLKMILELPETEDTVWGQELKKIWTDEAKVAKEAEQLNERIATAEAQLAKFDELLADGTMKEEAHAILSKDVTNPSTPFALDWLS